MPALMTKIPRDWSIEPLEELFSVSAGGDWDENNCVKLRDIEHPYPVVANALTPGAVQGYCSYYTVEGQTLTITGRGEVGHAVYRAEPYVPIVRLLALRPRREISPRFYAEFINMYAEFSLESTGVPQLTAPQIRPYLLAVPPVSEQHAIARLLADVDDLIATVERMIAKKQSVKQGMMQQLLTGHTRLPGFDEAWNYVTFESVATLVSDRVMPQTAHKVMPLIELEHVEPSSGRLIDSSFASSATSLKARFRRGDVLFGKLRSYLRKYWLANKDGLCSTEFWVFRPKTNFTSLYLRYLVESEPFINEAINAYGTHMPRADWRVVRELVFAVPPFAEQRAIGEVLKDVDDEIDVLRERLGKAREVKIGMMQQLLTGRVRLPVEVAVRSFEQLAD